MGQFEMERVTLTATLHCNLKCARCISDIPYYGKKAVHFPLENLKRGIKCYFEIVDHVRKFVVSGGELFLYPDLPGIFDYLQQYTNRFDMIEVLSNGTILPNEATIYALKALGSKVHVLVDNYGEKLSTKVHEIDALLTENEIWHTVRGNYEGDAHCGGWVDFGDPLKRKLYTKEDIEKLYSKCAHPQRLKFCFGIQNGIMWPCPFARRCNELGVTHDNYDEYINLFDDSLTVEQQREKFKRIYSFKSMSACAYCNGMCDDSKRYIPAVQLTREELACVKQGARNYHEVCDMLSGGGYSLNKTGGVLGVDEKVHALRSRRGIQPRGRGDYPDDRTHPAAA